MPLTCNFPVGGGPGPGAPDPHADVPCSAPLTYRGLIASNFQEKGNELYRYDCPLGHTVLFEWTAEMGDDEQEAADGPTASEG